VASHSIGPVGDLCTAVGTGLFGAVYRLDMAFDHVRVPKAFVAFQALALDRPRFNVDADMASEGVSREHTSWVRLR
jgi:hypothetical protein